jgi:hypothetical protein
MDIRPARMEDVPEIAAVHVRSGQAAYRGLLPQVGSMCTESERRDLFGAASWPPLVLR